MRALLLENIHPDAAAQLKADGYDVETDSGALGEDELITALPGIDLLGIRSTTYLTKKVLAAADQLLAVGAFCIGTNQIDLAAASKRGVAVFNAPYSNTRSVVEIAIGSIVALARRLTDKNAAMHRGVWDKSAKGSHEVRGRSLGIVGYGNIGSQLSVLAEAFGMRVYFYDTDDKLALGNATRCGSLAELLETAEVVSLHVDGRQGNQDLFGESQFAAMRPTFDLHEPVARLRGRPCSVAQIHRVRAHRGRRDRRLPHRAEAPGRPLRVGAAGAAPTSSSPRTSVAARRRRRRTSGRFVAGKLRDYAATGNTSLSVNFPGVRPGTWEASTDWRTSTPTCPACWRRSTDCSPRTV
jgi:D-3-phosphoglycerate dehydrogenase